MQSRPLPPPALDKIEQRLDRVALKSELLDLKGRVEALERKIVELEGQL